jgi:D-galactarolactone cycloisomerase
MNKREFIKTSFLGTGGLMFANQSLFAANNTERFPELAKHKIQKVEVVTVDYHWPRHVGKNGAKDNHGQYNKGSVLKVYTDQGAMGWGLTDHGVSSAFSLIQGKKVSDLITPNKGLTDGLNVLYFDLP